MAKHVWVPPPGWPVPPRNWVPLPGWQPDPSWPPAPDGWRFSRAVPPSRVEVGLFGVLAFASAFSVLALGLEIRQRANRFFADIAHPATPSFGIRHLHGGSFLLTVAAIALGIWWLVRFAPSSRSRVGKYVPVLATVVALLASHRLNWAYLRSLGLDQPGFHVGIPHARTWPAVVVGVLGCLAFLSLTASAVLHPRE